MRIVFGSGQFQRFDGGSAGNTVEETVANIREALLFHFDGMREDGDAIPDPETLVDYVDVPAGHRAATGAA
jgi:hypothetical protein